MSATGGLVIEGLRVTVGAFTLTVDLSLGPTDAVAVIGPNGAGKTTLLRALAGLLPIDAGRVTLGDRVLEDAVTDLHVPPQQRGVGVVFQDVRLFPKLDVRENVAFGPRSRGATRRDAHAVAERHLADVGLATFTGRPTAGLSGGEAQRVGLARALATDPEVLLLDEPLAAVDVEARGGLREVVRQRIDALGRPALIVTHDPADALVLADRIVVLEDGRVVQDASADEVRARPASAWVARMLGA